MSSGSACSSGASPQCAHHGSMTFPEKEGGGSGERADVAINFIISGLARVVMGLGMLWQLGHQLSKAMKAAKVTMLFC